MSATAPTAGAAAAGPPGKRPRDPRLDFFRGCAMFIILLAHTPKNGWTLWIPARFGFSDATEIFVFCSGMASAMAFGAVFVERGLLLGTARVGFRVWQVYWAHVGVFLFTVAMLAAINLWELGAPGFDYRERPYVMPVFDNTEAAVVGLLTLTYVPGLFDILPMYLVILAMIPAVMALHRIGGGPAVGAAVAVVWLGATLAGLARTVAAEGAAAGPLATMGEAFLWMNLPARPWAGATWFFNPFGWQLVFFTGFAFGMGWLAPPPVSRRLIRLAVGALLLTIPFAWHRLHAGVYLPDSWLLQDWLEAAREVIEPLRWKTWQGLLRYLHFLALAYLAWVAVGPRGARLDRGFAPPPRRPAAQRRRWALAAVPVAALTIPYAWIGEIKAVAPALDAWILANLPMLGAALGWVQMAHAAALAVIVWNALPQSARDWTHGPMIRRATPVIRKVGTQSLAVFMVSIPLSQAMGVVFDLHGSTIPMLLLVNLSGFALLIGTAYFCAWIKGHPWRRPAAKPAAAMPAPAE